jgi:cytochrome c-type biogenesis protein CcmH
MNRIMGLLILLWVGLAPVLAVEPDEILKDTTLEARARSISSELRCLVCQNQSIDDSHAPLARDLRVLVRQKLTDGESDDAIKGFLVDRYGDFILLKPRFSADTMILWLSPFVVLAIGGWAIIGFSRRQTTANAAPLDMAEHQRLAALLDGKDASSS